MARTYFDFTHGPPMGSSEDEMIRWYMEQYKVPESQARVMVQEFLRVQEEKNKPAAPAPSAESGPIGMMTPYGWQWQMAPGVWSKEGAPLNMQTEGNQQALANLAAGKMGTQGSAGWPELPPDLQGKTRDIMATLLDNIKRQQQFGGFSPEEAVNMLGDLTKFGGSLLAGDEAQQLMDFRSQMLGGGELTPEMAARMQLFQTGQAPAWLGEQAGQAKNIKMIEDKIMRLEDQLAAPSTQQNPELKRSLQQQIDYLQQYLALVMSGSNSFPYYSRSSAGGGFGATDYRAELQKLAAMAGA